MFRIMSLPYSASLGIFLSVACPAIADGPFFMGLGQIEGYDGWGSFAQAVSGDGHVVIGSSQEGSDLAMAFRWTLEEGMVPLGFLPGGDSSFAKGVSGDGSVIVGSSKSYNTVEDGEWEAFKWTADTGMVGLGDLPGSKFESRAYDVTADGVTVVGSGVLDAVVSLRHPTRWIGDSPPEDLGGLPGVYWPESNGAALAVSADGSAIVGKSRGEHAGEAFLLTDEEGMISLGVLPGGSLYYGSIAWDVAVDTEITVVGMSYLQGYGHEAFRWTEATGMVGLGTLHGPTTGSTAHAVTPDGSVVVGGSGDDAFIWHSDHGMRDLGGVLTDEYGLDLTGWSALGTAYGISDDGLTVVGGGVHNGLGEAWIAHIPEPTTLTLFLVAICFAAGRRGALPPRPKS
jgi:probable HAF family extracellular repeat protein